VSGRKKAESRQGNDNVTPEAKIDGAAAILLLGSDNGIDYFKESST
jgi:hypothetical protein